MRAPKNWKKLAASVVFTFDLGLEPLTHPHATRDHLLLYAQP